MAERERSAGRATGGTSARGKAYAEFIKGLHLEEIFLLSASVRNDTGGRLSRSVQPIFAADVDMGECTKDGFEATYKFTFRGSETETKKDVIEIAASFLLRYKGTLPSSPDLLDMFKQTTLFMNAWPYFREYLQSTVVRCGLPSFTLPLAKILPKDATVTEKTAAVPKT
jgi:hypothetical protein